MERPQEPALTHEYEAAGGGYRGERTASQRHLEQWTEQDWHTRDGGADARGEDGTARYLPDAARELLSEEEQEATDRRKKRGGTQRVPNTEAARQAREAAELIDVSAPEARERVAAMDDAELLDRAEEAEERLEKGRTTVLRAIDQRRAALDERS